MGEVTHEQVNLMLRLYEMRREPRLREARSWFINNFHAQSMDEVMKNFPPGSEDGASIRMVVSYWEMVASIVNRGLIDEEFFFENSGEQWVVWERFRPLIAAWREGMKYPQMLSNLEEQCKRLDAWREKRAPGSTEALRQRLQQMARAQAQGK
jgi:hypothetical protein